MLKKIYLHIHNQYWHENVERKINPPNSLQVRCAGKWINAAITKTQIL
jgi:hypothetical protein